MTKTFQDAVTTIRLPAPPVDVDLSNDGSRVAVALAAAPGTPSVCVYDTATGQQVAALAEAANFGRGVVFGKGGRFVYGLVEDPKARNMDLRRYPLDGGDSASVAVYPHNEYYALVRNQAADLIALLGHGVQVLHDSGGAKPDVVRIIAGVDPSRTVHAQLPAKGAYAYCSGVAADQVVRWDLQSNKPDGSWPAPDTHGRVAISRSGRYCIVTKHGGRGVFALDTQSGERFMPDSFHEKAINTYYAFAPDESGFVYPAGGEPGFRDWSTRSRFFGPSLFEGQTAGLFGAWDADVYVFSYDESRLCVVTMT